MYGTPVGLKQFVPVQFVNDPEDYEPTESLLNLAEKNGITHQYDPSTDTYEQLWPFPNIVKIYDENEKNDGGTLIHSYNGETEETQQMNSQGIVPTSSKSVEPLTRYEQYQLLKSAKTMGALQRMYEEDGYIDGMSSEEILRPTYRDNINTPQSTFFMDPELQRKVFKLKGYVEGTPGDYGLISGAAKKANNPPIYQTRYDAIDRSKLLHVGNILDNVGDWVSDSEAAIPDAYHHPAAFYVDKDGNPYVKEWDLNDYGGSTVPVVGSLIDMVGSPTVVTTGFQPTDTIPRGAFKNKRTRLGAILDTEQQQQNGWRQRYGYKTPEAVVTPEGVSFPYERDNAKGGYLPHKYDGTSEDTQKMQSKWRMPLFLTAEGREQWMDENAAEGTLPEFIVTRDKRLTEAQRKDMLNGVRQGLFEDEQGYREWVKRNTAPVSFTDAARQSINEVGDQWHNWWKYLDTLYTATALDEMGHPIRLANGEMSQVTSTPKRDLTSAAIGITLPISIATEGWIPTIAGLASGTGTGIAGAIGGQYIANKAGLNENAQEMFGDIGGFAGGAIGGYSGTERGKVLSNYVEGLRKRATSSTTKGVTGASTKFKNKFEAPEITIYPVDGEIQTASPMYPTQIQVLEDGKRVMKYGDKAVEYLKSANLETDPVLIESISEKSLKALEDTGVRISRLQHTGTQEGEGLYINDSTLPAAIRPSRRRMGANRPSVEQGTPQAIETTQTNVAEPAITETSPQTAPPLVPTRTSQTLGESLSQGDNTNIWGREGINTDAIGRHFTKSSIDTEAPPQQVLDIQDAMRRAFNNEDYNLQMNKVSKYQWDPEYLEAYIKLKESQRDELITLRGYQPNSWQIQKLDEDLQYLKTALAERYTVAIRPTEGYGNKVATSSDTNVPYSRDGNLPYVLVQRGTNTQIDPASVMGTGVKGVSYPRYGGIGRRYKRDRQGNFVLNNYGSRRTEGPQILTSPERELGIMMQEPEGAAHHLDSTYGQLQEIQVKLFTGLSDYLGHPATPQEYNTFIDSLGEDTLQALLEQSHNGHYQFRYTERDNSNKLEDLRQAFKLYARGGTLNIKTSDRDK